MPEGDTMARTAATLDRWLAGRVITAARGPGPGSPGASAASRRFPAARLVGQRVVAVEARGKHLLVRLSGGQVLHTHMRMSGSWHVYPAGAAWRRPARSARVVLEAGDRVAVCFEAPVVELLAPGAEDRHPALSALGPDVLAADVDVAGVERRAARRPGPTPVGDLLLDQGVVAGIGNIWRCETLFVCRTDPWRARADLAPGELAGLVTTAGSLMAAGLGPPGLRDSGRGQGRHWVYGRARRPCARCRTPIRAVRTGTHARVLYWCPACQAPGPWAGPGP